MERSTHQCERNTETQQPAQKMRDEQVCPECDADELIHSTDQGELICENCGLILEIDNIDRGPEWRAFTYSDRQQKSRVGAPTTQTMHDKGLTTQIGQQDKDGYGRSLSAEERLRVNNLRKWHNRIRTKNAGEQNLQHALGEIDRMASALGVPQSVHEVASTIYRRALSADLLRGRSIEGVATAGLYAACRRQGIPRSLDEITQISRVGRKKISRTYRYIARELELRMEPVNPLKYVPRFCSDLGLSEETQSKANEIIKANTEQGLHSGKSPTGYAAAAIYAAALLCNEKKTQHEVADVAQVSEMTIRKRYPEQIKILDDQ